MIISRGRRRPRFASPFSLTMDPFLPAMVLTSLCIAATKVYRHLRPNDQQPPPIQAEQHDGDNLETADSTASGSQEASFSEATSSARTSSEESPGLCDEKDTDGKSNESYFSCFNHS